MLKCNNKQISKKLSPFFILIMKWNKIVCENFLFPRNGNLVSVEFYDNDANKQSFYVQWTNENNGFLISRHSCIMETCLFSI